MSATWTHTLPLFFMAVMGLALLAYVVLDGYDLGVESAEDKARVNASSVHVDFMIGSPESVAQRIARTIQVLGLDRFDLKYSNGPLPHAAMMRSIELMGTAVAPRAAELLAG